MRNPFGAIGAAFAAAVFAFPVRAGIDAFGTTFTNIFRGTTSLDYADVSNWYTTDDGGTTWTPYSGSIAPGCTNSNQWSPILIDGNYVSDSAGEDGYKTVTLSTANVEGWNLQLGLAHGIHLSVQNIVKLQSASSNNDTGAIHVDETSKLTVATLGSQGSNCFGGAFHIASPKGLTVTNDLTASGNSPGYNYYLGARGSVSYAGLSNTRTHTVASVTLDCGDATKSGKEVVSRRLIGFTSQTGQTFAYVASGVSAQTADGTAVTSLEVTATPTLASAVGAYCFEEKEDGYYVTYVAYGDMTDENLYTRTLSGAADWSATDAWEHGSEKRDQPDDAGNASLTLSGDSTLTMNAASSLNSLEIKGTGALTFAGDGEATHTLTANTTVVNADVNASSGVTSLGAVALAEGKTLTVTQDGAFSGLSGTGTLKLDATGGAITHTNTNSTSPLLTFPGAVTLEGTDTNGVTLNFGTAVTAEFGPRLVVASGTHALTYGRSNNSDTTFASGDSDETPTVLVKDGATLNFTAKDLSGWNGTTTTDAGAVIRVASGGALNFLQVGSETCYYRQRLLIEPGAEVTIASSFDASNRFCLYGGLPSEEAEQLAVPATEAMDAAPATLSGGKINLAGAIGVAVGANATLKMDSQIVGSNALTKRGAGTLLLTAANTNTGAVNVTAGTLRLEGDGTPGTGTVTVAEGAALVFAGAADATFSNPLSGAGAITKEGAGTTALTGDLSGLTGPVTVTAGALDVTSASFGETAPSFALTAGSLTVAAGLEGKVTSVAEGATLRIRLTAEQRDVLGYTAAVPEGVTPTFEGPDGEELTDGEVNGATYTAPANVWTPAYPTEGDATKYAWDNAENWSRKSLPEAGAAVRVNIPETGPATLVLPAEEVSVGTLAVDGVGSLAIETEGGTLTVTEALAAHADMAFPSSALTYGTLAIDEGRTVTVTVPAGVTFASGRLSGGGTLAKQGEGTVRLTAASSANVVAEDVTLDIREGALETYWDGYSVNPCLRNATVAFAEGTAFRSHGWVELEDTVTFDVAGDLTLEAASGTTPSIGGTGTLRKIGAGRFAYVLRGSSHATPATIEAGTMAYHGGGEVGADGNGTLTGVISGAGAVEIASGTVTLSATNTYSGGTTIAEGATLTMTNRAALGSGAITGAGKLVVQGNYTGSNNVDPMANVNGLAAEGWTGTVSLTVTGTRAMLVLNTYGHAGSEIEFNGAQGWIPSGTTIAATARLTGEGLQLTNGSSQTEQTAFFAKLVGEGTLKGANGTAWKYDLFFADATEFAGDIDLQVSGTNSSQIAVVLGALPSGYAHDTYAGRILVPTGATATLAEGKTWTPYTGKAVTVASGTLGGTGTVDGALTLSAGATLDATKGPLTVSGAVSASGTVTEKANAYGPVLNASGVDASAFTLAEGTPEGLLVATGTALALVQKPADYGTVAAGKVAEAAAAAGLYADYTTVAQTHDANGTLRDLSADEVEAVLAVFSGGDLLAGDADKGTVTVAYDFGITRATVRTVDGALKVAVAAKAQDANGAALACEAANLSLTLNGAALPSATVVPDPATTLGETPADGEVWFTFPLSDLEGLGTFRLGVKATAP